MVIQLVKDGRYDYIETGSLISIRKNVKDILILSEEKKLHMYPMDYEDDFRKIDPTGKLSSLFDAIPAQLMGNASRYQVSSVISGSRAGDVLEQIAELKDSGNVIDAFSKKFSSRISREILIYTKDYQKEGRLEHLPIVMAQFI